MKNKELEKRIINLENKVDRFLGSQKLEPQHELKIGDKVKVVGVRNNIINNKEAVVQEIGTGIFSDMCLIKFDDEKLISSWINMSCLEPYTEPRWTFTDDEKVILRNIQKEYKWMARDKDGFLVISSEKLNKKEDCWIVDRVCAYYYFNIFNKLFQSIKFEDDEPCEFRKYI